MNTPAVTFRLNKDWHEFLKVEAKKRSIGQLEPVSVSNLIKECIVEKYGNRFDNFGGLEQEMLICCSGYYFGR